jgi:hypothetical protein
VPAPCPPRVCSSTGMSISRTLLALATCALFSGGCNYFEPRWVLWAWVTGVWVPINEYRTLEEGNRFLTLGTTPTSQRCMPFGQVPTQAPPPR